MGRIGIAADSQILNTDFLIAAYFPGEIDHETIISKAKYEKSNIAGMDNNRWLCGRAQRRIRFRDFTRVKQNFRSGYSAIHGNS